MKNVTLLSAMLVLLAVPGLAHAQGRGPGGPPSQGQRGPGPQGGPGERKGHGEPGHERHATQPSGTAGAQGAPRNALQIGPTGRWWDDKTVVHSVGISPTQQKKMDTVFDANKPAILASYKILQAEQAKLASLNKSAQPDQAAVFAQIDSVSQARTALQKATTQMLLQIRQEMAPDQVQKLEQIQ